MNDTRPPPRLTPRSAGGITALDEVRALLDMQIHVALGMAIYTGRLDLDHLAVLNQNLRLTDQK
jgi:phosphoribosylformimino-5-aminoimidazole carboxamide ribonucleotide (ProFAR) isomerase